ncbi:hybrid sensor histidine kinase/response regulator [Bacteroidia bacterium]|nr:hybrid sensor histidine kinase/response regulator [Bacteroidia bacterium]
MAQSYVLKYLGLENGLSNNYVKDIAQDGQGCIWIATESGLNKFDGQSFTIYKENNSGLASNALNTLLYDREENTLWIGTQRNGISVFDRTTHRFENYTALEGLATNDVTYLSPAADGGIWITHYHVGIDYYDRKSKQFSLFKDLSSRSWCAVDDGNNHLYIGHVDDGLSILDIKNKAIRNFRHDPANPKSLPGNNVRIVCIDRMKNIWVGTNHGLALFNPQTEEFIRFQHDPANAGSLIADYVYDIQEMKDGTLWIATDAGGVSILNLQNTVFMNPEKVQFRNITASGNIRNLFQDGFDNIWIGSYGGGLDFIGNVQSTFHILPYSAVKDGKLKNKPVWGICADDEQQLWMGSENEFAVSQNFKVKQIFDLPESNTQIFTVKRDREKMLWMGLYGNILKFNPQTGRFERISLDISNVNDFITFFEDVDGKMWIGANDGLYSCTEGLIGKEDAINNQLSDRMIYSILRDRQGKLWVGTFGKGIFVFDKDNKLVIELNNETGFCSNAINHLYMDSSGGIWAATRNGVGYFNDSANPAQFELYDDKQELADSHVRAIQEDNAGNIWFSTDNGVSCWNKNSRKFDNYDYRDGIPMENFTIGSACSTSDGTIYFGSLGGVCYFNPKDIAEKRQVAPVQIMECKGFSKQIESRKEEFLISSRNGVLDLPYNQNSFRITFSVPDYSQSGQVEYAYIIEGLENVWHNIHSENQVTFRNIPHGEYKFKVKARLRNHEWDEAHIASVLIHIHTPFWFAWYAKLFYALVLGLGVYAFLYFYKHKLRLESSLELERKESHSKQELNDERLRFYTNITHELRTPLTLILGPLEDLLNDKNLSAGYNKKINIIHGSAMRLLNLINQILEFRKTETQNRKLTVCRENLGSLVTETGLRYKEMNRNEKVKFHINIETKDTELYFDADMITTILNNLLSNAVKYTPEGEIQLTLRTADEGGQKYIEIEVADTGYGIDAEALPHIFDRYYQAKDRHQVSGTGIGLALVKSLTDLHEGIIRVESTLGKGTIFQFLILKENRYPNALHKEGKKLSRAEIIEEENDEEADVHPILLVIEDNDDIRDYIATSLTPNYKVITASEGKTGLEAARKHIPNIIVSDIMMPVMDGIELCRAVKEDIRTSHIPVILLTAKDTIQDKEDGYESGADSYLTKPFSAKLLQSRIHNLLESRKKLAQQIAAYTKEPVPDKNQKPVKLSKLDDEFLAKLTTVIEENLNMDKMDIAFLTEKMKMSHSTFYRKVKGLTGISANEFIRKIRLKNSLQILLTGSHNISEAAYMTGFNDIKYFRECFKEEYGMSPSEYLKNADKQAAIQGEKI